MRPALYILFRGGLCVKHVDQTCMEIEECSIRNAEEIAWTLRRACYLPNLEDFVSDLEIEECSVRNAEEIA